jgi:hypothetical protein
MVGGGTTGEAVTTTVGGAGEGEALRGGVCARGDGVCGTGNGLSVLACLSAFFDSRSEEDEGEGEAGEEPPLLLLMFPASFLSALLSFLCRLSYNARSRVSAHMQLPTRQHTQEE